MSEHSFEMDKLSVTYSLNAGAGKIKVLYGGVVVWDSQFTVPKKEWDGLTEEESSLLFRSATDHTEYAQLIETKLREKNT
jgi:hypothetical protein